MNKQQPRLIYRLLPLLLLGICFISGVQAQDAHPTYHLVEPSAADFVEHAEAIINSAVTTYPEQRSFWEQERDAEADALIDEVKWRLFEQQQITYEQLLALYQADSPDAPSPSSSGDDEWLPLLIESYLTMHEVKLDSTPVLTFDGFIFDVKAWQMYSAYSLTLRAVPDWADPRYLISSGGEAFIAIANESGTYDLPSLPATMTGGMIGGGDLNADRQLDFAYIHYTHWGNSYVSGDLYVVTWTGEIMEVLTTVGFRHGTTDTTDLSPLTWQFRDVDNDSEQELVTSQVLYDNYGCNFVSVRFYDWQPDATLTNESGGVNLPETFDCLLRQAEETMWDHHYAEAISLYEQAFEQPDRDAELTPYAQMRLGLAYLFNEQPAEARQLLATLSHGENEEQSEWVNAVREAYLRDPRPLAVCQAVYDQAREILEPYDRITGMVYVSDGGFYGPGSYDPSINLENLSCDLPTVLAQQMATTEFTSDQPPTVQLEALGLTLSDSLVVDFDTDGRDEWIVWVDSPRIDALIFVPDDSGYFLTSPVQGIRSPAADNQYWVTRLPDNTPALVNIDFGEEPYDWYECGLYPCGGPVGTNTCVEDGSYFDIPPDEVTLWRLEDGELKSFFAAPLCQWATLEQLFPGGEGSSELHAYEYFPINDWDSEVRPSIFTWDMDRRTFVAPPQPTLIPPTPTLVPTPMPVPQPEYFLSFSTLRWVRTAFAERDFTKALEMIDAALTQESRDQALIMAFRYYRGLTLEALNRPEEALEEYIAIYEANPETAWGLLAGLHLQITP